MVYIRTKIHSENISKSLKEKYKNGYIHSMKNKKQSKQVIERMKNTIKKQYKNGRKPWNYGLTKETDERIIKYAIEVSITRKKRIREGKIKCFGHGISASRPGKLNFWYGKDRSGKLNPNWKGGIQYEPYSSNWTEELKEKIRKKYNRKCQLCGKFEKDNEWGRLQVHHIDYNKQNCYESNLIPLCVSCNFKVNYGRNFWIKYFKEKKCA